MKVFITILAITFYQIFFAQSDSLSNNKNYDIEIVDTIKFEGYFIMDEFESKVYFVNKNELKNINTSYKSYKRFNTEFKKVNKLNYLGSNDLKRLLKKHNNFNCESLDYLLFSPQISSISIYKEKEKNIYLSMLNIRLIKTQINTSILDDLMEYFILEKKVNKNVTFYSFLFCG